MSKNSCFLMFILLFFTSVPQIGDCKDLVNSQFVVQHGAYYELSFRVGILEKGELFGTFRSTDSIFVYVFDENGYNLFKRGKNAFPLYNSGKTTQGELRANLGKGRYWIIFDAQHALFKDRTVAASIALN